MSFQKKIKVCLLTGIGFSVVMITACNRSSYTLSQKTTHQYVFTDSVSGDNTIAAFIKPFHDSLAVVMNTKLAFSKQSMAKGLPESRLGDFAADAALCIAQQQLDSLKERKADFCFINSGGLRISLPQGFLTLENMYELMPFENELVAMDLDSAHYNKLFRYIAYLGGAPVSGISMVLSGKKLSSVSIGKNTPDPAVTYRVITSDYLANGGDNLEFLKDVKYKSLNIKVRDAFIRYLSELNQRKDSLNVELDGRIQSHAD